MQWWDMEGWMWGWQPNERPGTPYRGVRRQAMLAEASSEQLCKL